MRVLLDECIDESLRHYFSGHQCQTCRFAGFKGLTNGALLTAAEQAGFDVLITVDRNMQHQQRVANRTLSIVVIRSRTTGIDDLTGLMRDVLSALELLKPGQLVQVGST
jgi:hypothetical protein